METENKPLIYAVDDEAPIRELYEATLQTGGYLYEVFPGGEELFAALAKKIPSLVLLDVMLEGESGFEILAKMKKDPRYVSIPVLMVSAKGDELSQVKGLDLGASDYIAKPFGVIALLARIKARLREQEPQVNSLTYKGLSLNKDSHEAAVNGSPILLTKKEFALLEAFLSHQGELLTKEWIFSSIWGDSLEGLESRTIDVHINTLRKKINGGGAEIVTIRGEGYIFK